MNEAATADLAARARADLAALSYPATSWVMPRSTPEGDPIHATIVIGAGQSGLAIAAALRRDGVDDVVVFDRSPTGQEGVWDTFARMQELRTPKVLNGMDFGCPSLSVQAWYTARYGASAWVGLDRVPRRAWVDYLKWYRGTLDIAVENDTAVTDIRAAADGCLAVETRCGTTSTTRFARTVVIATGFDGVGGWQVPDFVSRAPAPRPLRSHQRTGRLRPAARRSRGRAGAWRFGLRQRQCGARSGCGPGRPLLSPRPPPAHQSAPAPRKCRYDDPLPPARSGDPVGHRPPLPGRRPATPAACPRGRPGASRFHLHPASPWLSVRLDREGIAVETPRATLLCDHLLCATGVGVDLASRPELTSLAPVVALWHDRYAPPEAEADARLAGYPFLDVDFSFTPRHDAAAWVGQVFCFNGAAAVSQGPHATSISGHRHAVPRLVRGVTGRLFAQQTAQVLERLASYGEIDLELPDDFEALHRSASHS